MVILLCLINFVPALAGTVQYTYDSIDRLTKAEATDSSMVIIYTYDEVGNRLSITAQGIGLDTPEVTDTGLFSLDNSMLEIDVTTYGEQYGDLDYEYAIGASLGAADVVDWTSFEVDPDGTATLEGLNLPHNQEYFVAVRLKNFADDVVTGVGSTDGITMLDPVADPDGDGFDNQSEVIAQSNPLNEDSFPAEITVDLDPGLNLAAIPAEVAYSKKLSSWMPFFGDSTQIEKVLYLDPQSGHYITLVPGETPLEDPMLTGAEGLIVHAFEAISVTFHSVFCASPDLQSGFNLIGVPCPPEGYTSFDLLQDYGSNSVTSIKRFSTEKGAFETAGFDEYGELCGINFPIVPGEGYVLFVKQ